MQAAARRRGSHLPSRPRQVAAGDLDRFDRILTVSRGCSDATVASPLGEKAELGRFARVTALSSGGA